MLTNNGWGIRKLDDYGIIKFFNNELREGDRTKGGDQDFVYVITAGFLKIAKTEKNRNITGRLKSERKQKQKATSKSVEHEIWPIFFPRRQWSSLLSGRERRPRRVCCVFQLPYFQCSTSTAYNSLALPYISAPWLNSVTTLCVCYALLSTRVTGN
jgi:hypothetical protein